MRALLALMLGVALLLLTSRIRDNTDSVEVLDWACEVSGVLGPVHSQYLWKHDSFGLVFVHAQDGVPGVDNVSEARCSCAIRPVADETAETGRGAPPGALPGSPSGCRPMRPDGRTLLGDGDSEAETLVAALEVAP